MFDLGLTQKLFELFSVPSEKRDGAWTSAFYAAAPDASLRALTPQVITGPDGFPYFALALPKAGEAFDSFCVAHVLDVCLENGFGAVIFPDQGQPPLWVFSYGNLCSYKQYGRFDGDPADEPSDIPPGPAVETVKEARKILTGAPSDDFLCKPARAVLARHLKALGVENPSVALMVDPALKPSRNLTFNLDAALFASRAEYDQAMQRLLWFLPPRRGLVGPNVVDPARFVALIPA